MRVLLGMVLVVSMGAVAAADDVDVKKLIGKWETKTDKSSNTIEFMKDGKMTLTADIGGGKDFKLDGTYKVDKDKLTFMMKFGNKETSKSVTVKKLTDEVLVTDDGKKETTMKKAK